MKWTVGGVALMTAILLAGCGSKSDPNEKNFGAAIDQYLDKHGDLCLDFVDRWPTYLSDEDLAKQEGKPTSVAGKLAALEAVGLVKSEKGEVPGMGYWGQPSDKKVAGRTYALTDAAKPFARDRKGLFSFKLSGDDAAEKPMIKLCWAKMAVDKVVKWEGPIKIGDYQEAPVKYQYKITGMADWAQNSDIRRAYPDIEKEIAGAGNQTYQRSLHLTSNGWEVNGLDD